MFFEVSEINKNEGLIWSEVFYNNFLCFETLQIHVQ